MLAISNKLRRFITKKVTTHVIFGGSPAFQQAYRIIAWIWIGVASMLLAAIMLHLSVMEIAMMSGILIVSASLFSWYFPNWYYGYLSNQFYQVKENPLLNPYLQGNYAPIQHEIHTQHLKINGEFPIGFSGIYLRNGPNPAFIPISYTYPIDGDGMIHAVEILNNKVSYRNRYVQTEALLAERKAQQALYSGISRPLWTLPSFIEKYGVRSFAKNGASIHVIHHAKRYLALSEAAEAYEMTHTLETIGTWCPPGAEKPFYVNAHTRYDDTTGDLHAFSYDIMPPRLTCYVLDQQGTLKSTTHIDKPHASLIHDFVLTENYIIFFDCPAIFDFEALWETGQLLTWQPEYNTTVILLNRQTNAISRIQMDPFFAYHLANGYEVDETLVVDYVRHEVFALGEALHTNFSLLYRLTINLSTHAFSHHELYDRPVEFPRINEVYTGKPYRYIYAPIKTVGHVNAYHGLLKYDLIERKALVHDFGRQQVDEAVFIPKPHETAEDAGWLAFFVYDPTKDSSQFVLLDAQDFQADPIATVLLPQRVPHGLHGSWVSADNNSLQAK